MQQSKLFFLNVVWIHQDIASQTYQNMKFTLVIYVLAPIQNCPYLEYTCKGTITFLAVQLRLQKHIFYMMTNLNLLYCAQSFSHSVMSNLFVTPWTAACQVPLSMGFSRQEYWSGSHAFLQGIYLTWGSDLGLPHCRWILYHLSHQGSPYDN